MSSPINIARLGRVGILVMVGDVVDWVERSLLFLLNVETLLGASPCRRNAGRIILHVLIHSVTLFLEPSVDKVLLGSLFSRKVAFTQAPCALGSSVRATRHLECVGVSRGRLT